MHRARDANRSTMPRAFTLRATLVVALACIASCPTPARALFDDLGDVVKLDAKNFDARVTNAKEDVYWLVKYYAPWFGHCKKLAPEWTKAAKTLKKEVGDKAKLGAVDCDDATNKALCAKFNVNGFPTLKGFAARGKESHDFDGARDADGIVQFVRTTRPPLNRTGGRSRLHRKGCRHRRVGGCVRAHPEGSARRRRVHLPDGVPSWWTSTAVKYKSGRRKDVAFAWVRHEDDPGVARNFKLDPSVDLPAVVYVAPNAEYHAFLRPAELGDRAGGKIRAAKAFVDKGRDGSLRGGADTRDGVPKFPEPRKPRKTADARYAPLTDENVLTDCFGSYRGTCAKSSWTRTAWTSSRRTRSWRSSRRGTGTIRSRSCGSTAARRRSSRERLALKSRAPRARGGEERPAQPIRGDGGERGRRPGRTRRERVFG